NNSREFPGGAWFAINGQLTWALAHLDGTVPDAAALAWDEFTRNTLAAHATAFPDHWNGVITVDDVCAAYYQSPPSGCGIGLANGAQVPSTVQDGLVTFTLQTTGGQPADWAVTGA